MKFFALAVVILFGVVIQSVAAAQADLPVPDEGGVYLSIDGVRVYAIDRGDPDDPAVLLLHGLAVRW